MDEESVSGRTRTVSSGDKPLPERVMCDPRRHLSSDEKKIPKLPDKDLNLLSKVEGKTPISYISDRTPNDSDEPPPQEEDLVHLSSPLSPFLSFSDYHEWAFISDDIDSGKLTPLLDIPNHEDKHLEHPIPTKGVKLSSINWKANNMPPDKTYDSPILQDKSNTTLVTHEPKQSPVRESLDSRIELLLKQTDGKSPFLDLGAASKQIGDVSIDDADSLCPLLRCFDAPPLPPDSSPLSLLPESDEPPPQEEENLVHLSSPPAPFLSFSDYHKWAVITNGKLTSLSDIPNHEDKHLEHPIPTKGVRLSSINWKADNMPPDKTYDSLFLQDKDDSTLVRDDDKMCLSFLSDGENKLEVNMCSFLDNATFSGTPQKPVNHVPTSSLPSSNVQNLHLSESQFTLPDFSDPHAATIKGVVGCVVKELKEVLKKDICDKIIEETAYKRFDQWWNEKLHQEKAKIFNPHKLEPKAVQFFQNVDYESFS